MYQIKQISKKVPKPYLLLNSFDKVYFAWQGFFYTSDKISLQDKDSTHKLECSP